MVQAVLLFAFARVNRDANFRVSFDLRNDVKHFIINYAASLFDLELTIDTIILNELNACHRNKSGSSTTGRW